MTTTTPFRGVCWSGLQSEPEYVPSDRELRAQEEAQRLDAFALTPRGVFLDAAFKLGDEFPMAMSRVLAAYSRGLADDRIAPDPKELEIAATTLAEVDHPLARKAIWALAAMRTEAV